MARWGSHARLIAVAGGAILVVTLAQTTAGACGAGPVALLSRIGEACLALGCVAALAAWRMPWRGGTAPGVAIDGCIDPVSGLMNRSGFVARLDAAHGVADAEIAILLIDINRFRKVNDMFGAAVGDRLLACVAARLRALLGPEAWLARTGDNEFAARLPAEAPEAAESLAGRATEALAQAFVIHDHQVTVSASAGVAFGNLLQDRGDELLNRASFALQEAKSSDLTRYRVFDDRMSERLSLKIEVRAALANAIAADELELYFQPVVATQDGRLVAAEALLRWRSPLLGSVSPDVFIPIAEESGQIAALSEWVLDRAMQAIARLGDVPVGVNISPVQFGERGFATALTDRVIAAGIDPGLFYIEITEGVLISRLERARETINQLREMGIKVYLDDFGTGYSSLSYLQNFELDALKIDKSFLRDMHLRGRSDQMLRSIIELGHGLGIKIVAEGAESERQAALLRSLGCDYLQGYHIAGPMPLEALTAFRDKNRARAGVEGQNRKEGLLF